jgi:cytoskeletal protein CcmA (bactofilin family)
MNGADPIAQTAHTIAELVSRPKALAPGPVPIPKEGRSFQAKMPVIIGEVQCKGTMAIDGLLGGQVSGNNNGSLGVRQKSSLLFASQPELSGDISFRDMVRVNGHIAGTIYSEKGTLIVDAHATVEANIEVAVAVINGTVHGDIVAQVRVEIGPVAKVYGNIWTRSIGLKDGAIFDGVCTMLESYRNSG